MLPPDGKRSAAEEGSAYHARCLWEVSEMVGGRDPIHDDPEFQELRRRFVVESAGNVLEMEGILERSGGALPAAEEGRRFRKLAHDLRGSGGSYGFPIVSLYGGEAEDVYLEGGRPEALAAIVGMLSSSIRQAGVLIGLPGA